LAGVFLQKAVLVDCLLQIDEYRGDHNVTSDDFLVGHEAGECLGMPEAGYLPTPQIGAPGR
jgi:hypothetical protein